MKLSLTLLRNLFLFALLSLSLTLPVMGVTRVKSGSGYGQNDTNGIADCLLPAVAANNCEAFQPGGSGSFTETNGTSTVVNFLPAVQFTDTGSGDIGAIFDVFDLGLVADGTTISMGSTTLGVFVCSRIGQPSDHAFDSNGPDNSDLSPGLPCTPILLPAVQTGSVIGTTVNGSNPFNFVLNADGSVTINKSSQTDVVLFDQETPNSTTPEPATFGLLSISLTVLAGLFVRRSA